MKLNLHHFVCLLILFTISCQGRKGASEHNHDSTASTPMAQADTIKKSIPREAHAQIGNGHVMIKYHAPAVRGRTIWGGLVPYGEVWVTGAHSATTFETDRNIVVANKEIPAGKYALFTIPRQDKWTVIINSHWDQHLADEYNEKQDVMRLEISPEQNEIVQERLTYTIIADGDTKGMVSISWEKIKLSMPFQVK
jgi:hypothetical protein